MTSAIVDMALTVIFVDSTKKRRECNIVGPTVRSEIDRWHFSVGPTVFFPGVGEEALRAVPHVVLQRGRTSEKLPPAAQTLRVLPVQLQS